MEAVETTRRKIEKDWQDYVASMIEDTSIGAGSPLTPLTVTRWHECYVGSLESGVLMMAEELKEHYKGLTAEAALKLVNSTVTLFKDATLYLWDRDMWNSALKGNEVFVGEHLSEVNLKPNIQLWVPTHDFFYHSPGTLDLMNITNCRCVTQSCVLLVDDHNLLFVVQFFEIADTEALKNGACPVIMRYQTVDKSKQVDEDTAPMVALHQFMNLKIVQVVDHRQLRAERRRAEREKRKIPMVKVVKLRKIEHHKDGSETHHEVEWSCRWFVTGHWRNQWYPSIESHKPTYIESYVKGPDDKPLAPARKTIFKVAR